ncbi:hypothetical protein BJ165DRAFT_1426264 [Panaeolus papilionaceus]|nr:hypothetical protein BJ165DRAFT_1426264 [Panaeolus papilionaceus]
MSTQDIKIPGQSIQHETEKGKAHTVIRYTPTPRAPMPRDTRLLPSSARKHRCHSFRRDCQCRQFASHCFTTYCRVRLECTG